MKRIVQSFYQHMTFPVAVHQFSKRFDQQTVAHQPSLKMFAGHLRPLQGAVRVGSHDVTKHPWQAKEHIDHSSEHKLCYLEAYAHGYLPFMGSIHGLQYE